MAQCKKEEWAGGFYAQYLYPFGVLRNHTQKQRQERKNLTTEAKQKINKIQRKYELMKLVGANFESGKDLFICLTFGIKLDEDGIKKAIATFRRRVISAYERVGIALRAVCVYEEHDMDGEHVREHYHLIISGAGRNSAEILRKAWDWGKVDVRPLRELTDNFEDTCDYLLKSRKPKHKRAYSCWGKMKAPPEPLRQRVPDSVTAQLPPGVREVHHIVRAEGEIGRYEIVVCKVVDKVLFDRYIKQQTAKVKSQRESATWRKYYNRRK